MEIILISAFICGVIFLLLVADAIREAKAQSKILDDCIAILGDLDKELDKCIETMEKCVKVHEGFVKEFESNLTK